VSRERAHRVDRSVELREYLHDSVGGREPAARGGLEKGRQRVFRRRQRWEPSTAGGR
jgi:hypothetical protein